MTASSFSSVPSPGKPWLSLQAAAQARHPMQRVMSIRRARAGAVSFAMRSVVVMASSSSPR